MARAFGSGPKGRRFKSSRPDLAARDAATKGCNENWLLYVCSTDLENVGEFFDAYDDGGVLLGNYSVQLTSFGHTAFLLTDRIPATQGKQGVLQISGGVAPLGFKFIQGGSRFTTWMP